MTRGRNADRLRPPPDETLVPRFAGRDGRPATFLDATAGRARDETLEKLASGAYSLESTPCPLCRSGPSRTVAGTELYGLPVRNVLCLVCGFLYQSPRMTGRSLGSFYNAEYRRLDRGAADDPERFFRFQVGKGEALIAHLRARGVLEEVAGRLVVEVGCGAGGILAAFREAGFDVVGADLGRHYLGAGRRQGLHLVEGGLEELIAATDERGEIGLVIYEQVLEHVGDPVAELRALREAIPEQAVVFVGVPGVRNVGPGHGHDLLHYLQLPHLVHFELRTLATAAWQAGFQVVHGDEQIQAVLRPIRTSPPEEGAPGPDTTAAESVAAFLRSEEEQRSRGLVARIPRDMARHVLHRMRGLPGRYAPRPLWRDLVAPRR